MINKIQFIYVFYFIVGWSILYVGIALLSLLLLAMSGIWGIICLCSRLCHPRTQNDKTRYALLESTEQVRCEL